MTTRTVVHSDDAPKAIGPYSQAIKAGNLLFCSGQIPLDPKTGEMVGASDVREQARRVMQNLEAVLTAGGRFVRQRRQDDDLSEGPGRLRRGQRDLRRLLSRRRRRRAPRCRWRGCRGVRCVEIDAMAVVG